MDPQIVLFRRQYFQLFEPDFLAWPPEQLLRDPHVQRWIYWKMFSGYTNRYLPSHRYQVRVLKSLVARIEKAMQDPEEDEISDDLMSHLSILLASGLPSESMAVQQKSYVMFSCLPPSTSLSEVPDKEPIITLLERRNLISGSSTTGFRTWEAALHLGSYLLTPEASDLIRGKNVIELGAGTGFVSVLCAKHLGAKHVTTTDGDEAVIEALKENLFLNSLDDEVKVNASVLRWGQGLKGTWVDDECELWPYDIVLGADITYDKTSISALVGTLRLLFDLRPSIQVLMSGAIRNNETFEHFRNACSRSNFNVEDVDFPARPIRDQIALFYATAVPLRILAITKP